LRESDTFAAIKIAAITPTIAKNSVVPRVVLPRELTLPFRGWAEHAADSGYLQE
jgi:hypothetical protein